MNASKQWGLSKPLSRRGALTLFGGVGLTAALAACGSDSSNGADGTSPAGTPAATDESTTNDGQVAGNATPVEHPAGLSYGTWLRADSHLLQVGGTSAVLVEFLDFQCPACANVVPIVEKLMSDLSDLTFGIRNYPLPMHDHALASAYAAEAAALQGQLQPMYKRLYAGQAEWNTSPNPSSVFEGYADELGLDVDKWNTDRASTEVLARVQADLKDAQSLGLSGTPSFILNGEQLQVTSVEQLYAAVEAVL